MSTKTGTPGFSIDGKSYTFDVGDPAAPDDPSYPVATEKSVDVDDSLRDISPTTKKTLADYMGKRTRVNYYPVDETYTSVRVTGDNNTTPPIPDSSQTTQNSTWFTRGQRSIAGTTDSSVQLKGWMPENAFVPPDVSTAKIQKGKESGNDGSKVNGNDVLRQVKGNTPDHPADLGTLTTYTQSVLRNNRFTSDAPVAQFDISSPSKDYNPTLHSPKFGAFTTRRLAQVAASLSIRASRELNSAANNSNPNSGGTEAKAILPSFNQLGATKVDNVLLEAQDVLQNLSNDEASLSSISGGVFPNASWGSLNNVHDTFSGITSFGMQTLALALTAGITLLFEGLAVIFSIFKGTPEFKKTSTGRYVLGRSTVNKMSNPSSFPPSFDASIIGIRPTVNSFNDCLTSGMESFFRLDSISASMDSPGYNVVVARSIVRSIIGIIDSIKKIFSSSNLIAGIKNILSMVDTLRSSKLIAAINVFTNLGDAVLLEDSRTVITEGSVSGEPKKVSTVDSQRDDIIGAAAIKNRLGTGGSLKLAWASNRAPAMYLLPQEIATFQTIASDIGAFQSGYGMQEQKTRAQYKLLENSAVNGGRIPIGNDGIADENTVRALESALESEYVPFYFHDIRTNEIIAFHAFLASLSDDYTANYEQSEGFGRVEPVKIYKNTTRKIGMSFHVAATSPADFNDMWVKINKLTTMVYPQYTEGRWLTDGTRKFVQPFSQMIGASPMVRIRLGNLLRSNYSRFALARLFGATIPGAQFGDNTFDLSTGVNGTYTELQNAKSSTDSRYQWLVPEGMTLDRGDAHTALQWKIDRIASYIPVTIEKLSPDNPSLVQVKPHVPTADMLAEEGITDPKVISGIIQSVNELSRNKGTDVIDGQYFINSEHLKPSRLTIKQSVSRRQLDSGAGYQDLTNFLDLEKNAIVKSFRSTSGKGLAGFIDSMQFDWYDHTVWDVDRDKLAPQMCKVSLQFSPIHDITPGIDSQGYNRAPIYPIGFMTSHDREKQGGK